MPTWDPLKPTKGVVGIMQGSNIAYFVSVLKERAQRAISDKLTDTKFSNEKKFVDQYDPLQLDFVFDHQRNVIGLGYNLKENKFGHDGIADHIGVGLSFSGDERSERIVGGRIRYENNKFITTEWSGHYGMFWNDKIRSNFVCLLEKLTGLEVDHQIWKQPVTPQKVEGNVTPLTSPSPSPSLSPSPLTSQTPTFGGGLFLPVAVRSPENIQCSPERDDVSPNQFTKS